MSELKNVRPAPTARIPYPDGELSQRLIAADELLKTALADYEAATEELRTTQEELTCVNEELQKLNDDLTGANVELHRLNGELRSRNTELERTRNDLASLLRSSGVAIIVFGTDLRVRRYTPHAEGLFHLRDSDVGRPLRDLSAFREDGLERSCIQVLETLEPMRLMIKDGAGQSNTVCLRPYRTVDHRIDGIVLVVSETA